MSATTYITRTPEEDAAYAKQCAQEAIEAYRELTQEQLVPKQKVMDAFGWLSDEKFYKERKARKVEAVDTWGNVPVYHLSDFLNQ